MDPFELVNVAVDLVERGVEEGAVRPEYMKRATSTLYYVSLLCFIAYRGLMRMSLPVLAVEKRGYQ